MYYSTFESTAVPNVISRTRYLGTGTRYRAVMYLGTTVRSLSAPGDSAQTFGFDDTEDRTAVFRHA